MIFFWKLKNNINTEILILQLSIINTRYQNQIITCKNALPSGFNTLSWALIDLASCVLQNFLQYPMALSIFIEDKKEVLN